VERNSSNLTIFDGTENSNKILKKHKLF